MLVSAIMTPGPLTVREETSLDEAMRLMDENEVRHLPVVRDGALYGVLSDRDLLEATGWRPAGLRDAASPALVADIVDDDVVTAGPDDSVVTVSVDIVVRGIGCLPVVADGALLGIVTEMDLLRAFQKACVDGRLFGEVDPPVSDHMTRAVRTVDTDQAIEEAIDACRELAVRHLPVMEDGRFMGILSDRDLRRAIGRGVALDTPVREAMTRDTLIVEPHERMSRAATLMHEAKISALPVLDDGELVGILTLTDLLDHCMNTLREPDAYA